MPLGSFSRVCFMRNIPPPNALSHRSFWQIASFTYMFHICSPLLLLSILCFALSHKVTIFNVPLFFSYVLCVVNTWCIYIYSCILSFENRMWRFDPSGWRRTFKDIISRSFSYFPLLVCNHGLQHERIQEKKVLQVEGSFLDYENFTKQMTSCWGPLN